MNQPLDAFLCFDVEATCVADKLIDWPNEIIVSMLNTDSTISMLMERPHHKEFPVILLGWADEEEEDTTRVDRELDEVASSVRSETPPPPEANQSGISSNSKGKRTEQDKEVEDERSASRESGQLQETGNSNEHEGRVIAQAQKSALTPPESNTNTPKEVAATETPPDFNVRVGQLPGKKLVAIDKFHSYVRPMWQPKLTKFCTGLTGIQQVCERSQPPLLHLLNRFTWLSACSARCLFLRRRLIVRQPSQR